MGWFNRAATPEQIEAGFRKRSPWVTRFKIGGRDYGGAHSFATDRRIEQFYAAFPDARAILELGSLEGGQTFELARRPDVQVTAVEGRRFNLEKARFVQKLLGVRNVRFVQADLEKKALDEFGRFDVVFCSGLLYHLPRPWELLDRLWAASHRVFMWTHYAAVDRVTETREGFPGHWYQEHGPTDPLSGLSMQSYWITLPSLIERLRRNGFARVTVIEDDPVHPNGPCVTLAAWEG